MSQPLREIIPVLGVIGGIGSGKSSVARRLQSLRPIAVIDADQFGHQVLQLPNVQEQILKRFGPTVFETDFQANPQISAQSGTSLSHRRACDVNANSHALPDGQSVPPELTANPQISRAALGRVVFGSDVAAETARRDLEAIVHPEIRSLLEREIREIRSGGTSLSHRRACDETSNDHALSDGQGVPPEPELRRQANVEAIVLDAAVLLEAGWNDLCDVVVFIDTPQADRIARVQAGRGWSAAELAKREASQWPLPRKRAAADAVLDNSTDVDYAARQLEQVIQNFALR